MYLSSGCPRSPCLVFATLSSDTRTVTGTGILFAESVLLILSSKSNSIKDSSALLPFRFSFSVHSYLIISLSFLIKTFSFSFVIVIGTTQAPPSYLFLHHPHCRLSHIRLTYLLCIFHICPHTQLTHIMTLFFST